MKSLLLFLFVLFALSSTTAAQTKSRVRIKSDSRAGVTVISGSKTLRVDLSKDIAGCPFIEAGKYKRDLQKRGCAAGAASFKLIDATVKDGETFVVVFSNAMGSCNACGQCGATGAHSLVWIRLDSKFKFVAKQAVVLESCFDNVGLIQPEWRNTVEGDSISGDVDFSFDKSKLTVKFEKVNYGGDGNSTYDLSTLIYDKGRPEAGFVISVSSSRKSAGSN